MKLTRRRAVSLAFVGFCLLYAGYRYVGWQQRASAIAAVCDWGRLAPLPPSAKIIEVSTEGNMFTRALRVRFVSDAASIERWLGESPGTRERPPTRRGSSRHYKVVPGGGAQAAEVEVNDSSHEVTIYACWG